MIKDFQFKTKGKDLQEIISVMGVDPQVPIHDNQYHDVECNWGQVDWEIYFELREYGIKYMDVKFLAMEIELTWLNEEGDDIETITYTMSDFEHSIADFDLKFDNHFGNRHIEVTELLVDFFEKKVTLTIN